MHTILAHHMISLKPPRENKVVWSIIESEKIVGLAEKNKLGQETGTIGVFLNLEH